MTTETEINSMTINHTMNARPLSEVDPQIFQAIEQEKVRQQSHIELIASENFTLPSIIEATGSVFNQQIRRRLSIKRYYGGCEHVDVAESLAIERAKRLFGAEHANVQPHSGSQANTAVYFAMLQPKDKILTMSLQDGGHLTHGHPKNCSGMLYDVINYGVDPQSGLIDYDAIEALAEQEKPKLITVGASAYSRIIDFEKEWGIFINQTVLFCLPTLLILPDWLLQGYTRPPSHMLILLRLPLIKHFVVLEVV